MYRQERLGRSCKSVLGGSRQDVIYLVAQHPSEGTAQQAAPPGCGFLADRAGDEVVHSLAVDVDKGDDHAFRHMGEGEHPLPSRQSSILPALAISAEVYHHKVVEDIALRAFFQAQPGYAKVQEPQEGFELVLHLR